MHQRASSVGGRVLLGVRLDHMKARHQGLGMGDGEPGAQPDAVRRSVDGCDEPARALLDGRDQRLVRGRPPYRRRMRSVGQVGR